MDTKKSIRIAGIEPESITDGEGIRYTIFTQGCNHKCKGCHNESTHSITGGKEVDIQEIIRDIEKLDYLDGVTISGGDPLLQPEQTLDLVKRIKGLGINIWVYTGFTFEQLTKMNNKSIREILKSIDILVDGKYEEKLRDLTLRFRGSSNQRIINIKDTLSNGNKIALY